MINTLPLSVPGHLNLTMLMMMTMLMMVGSRWKNWMEGSSTQSIIYECVDKELFLGSIIVVATG